MSLSLSDEDFGKLVAGKTQAQRLFMSGKLKIKGNVMKVQAEPCPPSSSDTLTASARPPRWSRSSKLPQRRPSCSCSFYYGSSAESVG